MKSVLSTRSPTRTRHGNSPSTEIVAGCEVAKCLYLRPLIWADPLPPAGIDSIGVTKFQWPS